MNRGVLGLRHVLGLVLGLRDVGGDVARTGDVLGLVASVVLGLCHVLDVGLVNCVRDVLGDVLGMVLGLVLCLVLGLVKCGGHDLLFVHRVVHRDVLVFGLVHFNVLNSLGT